MRLTFFFCAWLMCFASMSWADSLCVTKSGAVLRAEPQEKALMSWQVPKYMPLKSTGSRQNGFAEVIDVDGERHWASLRDVSAKMKCLVVRTRRSKLRTGPGINFAPSDLGVADRYGTFIDMGGEDEWTQVQDELGGRAWISLDHVWKPQKRMRMSFEAD